VRQTIVLLIGISLSTSFINSGFAINLVIKQSIVTIKVLE